MSTKRPSAIGLRKGLATAANAAPVRDRTSATSGDAADLPQMQRPVRDRTPAPVRVTLNFPPDLFRQLDGWTRDAADTIGAPRVGVQDAVRAMVRVIASGQARNAEAQVLAELQQARQR